MGLRCSLLGHDYGEAFVERDREERGDEVVVTERELKECARCGSEKVTAENTEVRSLQAERRERADAAPEPDQSTTEESTSEPATAADDGGAASGAFTSATDAIEQAEAGMETDDALAGEPDEDDAVILDGDAGDEPGSDQWEEPAEPEADPDPEPVEDDAEVVDAGPASEPESSGTQTEYVEQPQSQPESESTDLDRERGAWPDADGEDEGFDATETADVDAEVSATETDDSTFEFGAEEGVVEADTGFTSAGPLDNDESADELDFALYCPECGFERYAAGSSLRAGDICPECQRGYLAEDR
ncbi:DUF7093 family protein [Halobacterium noricense]|uniref:DUF7093 family protein n=1 Tax=Halobacterium noricense TaxID=223182 RepID=UPI001E30AC06|nr:hypothetical protein [Halobacterium noricense]UHH25517.1 hypothetical protein LT974_00895 [Halobacterium noricense]